MKTILREWNREKDKHFEKGTKAVWAGKQATGIRIQDRALSLVNEAKATAAGYNEKEQYFITSYSIEIFVILSQ